MEENLSNGFPLAVTHLLQHTLRSLCLHENSQWVYAVFWRILPRNYPPPKWDLPGGPYDRSRGNRRNWILAWEDGFCNFMASASAGVGGGLGGTEIIQQKGLQPELFFKMSHEIYNYGEGVIGKVAADQGHKWIFRDPEENEINFLSAWHNPADSYPRTWEGQFQSGIQTIALVAVREGVLQLGAINKVTEDINYILLLRKRLSYIESIPGVLLPHPSSAFLPIKSDGTFPIMGHDQWPYNQPNGIPSPTNTHGDHYTDYLSLGPLANGQHFKITPSMTSLEALLSKLPSVEPVNSGSIPYYTTVQRYGLGGKGKMEEDEYGVVHESQLDHGESSSSMCSLQQH